MTCRSVWKKERRRPESVTDRPKKEKPGREGLPAGLVVIETEDPDPSVSD